MWHIKALISLEWKNRTGWNLLSFFPIWTTSKAIKCWKLGLFSFSAPAYFINPVNPSINYNRIAAFLSGRHRSRPKGRVQASFFFRSTLCGSEWDQFMQKAPSLGFAPHPCCQPPAWDWAQLTAGAHLGLFPFPQFLNLSNLWMSTRMKQRMLIIEMLYQGNKFPLRAESLICHIVSCQAVASWTCWPTHPTALILLGMSGYYLSLPQHFVDELGEFVLSVSHSPGAFKSVWHPSLDVRDYLLSQ